MKELSDLVRQVTPSAKARNARIAFLLVYPDKRGRQLIREIGSTLNSRRTPDEARTLDSVRFEIGDYLCVEIFPDGPGGGGGRGFPRDDRHVDRMQH